MTVRVTVAAWFRSREPEGWDHHAPEVFTFPDRAHANAFVDQEKRLLTVINAMRGRAGLGLYKTQIEIEETA